MAHPSDIAVTPGAGATITPPAPFGRAGADDSKPVALSTQDKAALDAVATQVTAAAILAKIIAAPATAAKQPALGTAGTASTDVITVQGIAGGVAQTVVKGQQSVTDVTIVIATSTTVSGAVDLGVYRPVGLLIPATADGTVLNFQTSYDGTNYADLYDDVGNKVAVTFVAATARQVALQPALFCGVRYLKIVSASAQTTTDTVFKLIAEA